MHISPNIVVVDNELDQLDNIKNAFFNAGIPCLPILYKNNEPDNESGIDHVTVSINFSPRILVLDLNLIEAANPNAQTLVAPLARVIEKLNVVGPYLLCIWSRLDQMVQEVMDLLEARYKDKLILPIEWSLLSKVELLDNHNKLEDRLRLLIEEHHLFDALLTWESRISEAARRTTDALFSLSTDINDQNFLNDRSLRFQKVLGTIANEALGKEHASRNPALAMDTGFTPILEDQLSSLSQQELNQKWMSSVPQIGNSIELENAIKAKLNTFFHIEEVEENFPKDHRGVFVKLDMDYVQGHLAKFKQRIGRKLKALIHEEFINSQNCSSQQRDEIRERLILGFLEVSAACDHAQRKIKLPKYILGVLIPEQYEEHTNFGEKPFSHAGIYRLPNIIYKNNPYILKFSFKYQIGAQPEDHKWFSEPLFRVREQILSEITFNSSQYSSRPGIISFR